MRPLKNLAFACFVAFGAISSARAQPVGEPPDPGAGSGSGITTNVVVNSCPQQQIDDAVQKAVTECRSDASKTQSELDKCESDLEDAKEKACSAPAPATKVRCRDATTKEWRQGYDRNNNTWCDGSAPRKPKVAPEPGPQGPPGTGVAARFVPLTEDDTGHDCTNGGYWLFVGPDTDGDGTLSYEEAKAASHKPICHGLDGNDGEDGQDGVNGTTSRVVPRKNTLSIEVGVNYRGLYLDSYASDGRPDGTIMAPEVIATLRGRRLGLMVGYARATQNDGAQTARVLLLFQPPKVPKWATLRFGGEGQYWATVAPPGEQSGTSVWDTYLVTAGLELTIHKWKRFRLTASGDFGVGDDGFDEKSDLALTYEAAVGLTTNVF